MVCRGIYFSSISTTPGYIPFVGYQHQTLQNMSSVLCLIAETKCIALGLDLVIKDGTLKAPMLHRYTSLQLNHGGILNVVQYLKTFSSIKPAMGQAGRGARNEKRRPIPVSLYGED